MRHKLAFYDFESVTVDDYGQITQRRKGQAKSFTIELGSSARLEMVEIPGGSFIMGASEDEIEHRKNETPPHRVHVQPFYLGKFPVTQIQWLAVMENLPKIDAEFRGDNLPVVNVWLEHALLFCRKLSQSTGREIHLPTEAEWEYAARGGTTAPFNCGASITTELANFDGSKPYSHTPPGEFRRRLTPVDYFRTANNFGLYDMHGNVWEWCADIWHEDYNGAPSDGSAWLAGGDRGYCVQRGGSWRDAAGKCRSAFRVGDIAHNNDHIVGLRVCLSG